MTFQTNQTSESLPPAKDVHCLSLGYIALPGVEGLINLTIQILLCGVFYHRAFKKFINEKCISVVREPTQVKRLYPLPKLDFRLAK